MRAGPLLAIGGTAIGTFLGLVFLFRPWPDKTADRLLGFAFVAVALSQVSFLATGETFLSTVPHLARVGYPALILMAPLFLLYMQRVTGPGFVLRPRHLLHALPAVGFLALFSPYYFASALLKVAFGDDSNPVSYLDFGLAWYFVLAYVLGYFVLILVLLARHQRRIREVFSDLSRIRLAWLWRLHLLGSGCWLIVIVVSLTDVYSLRSDAYKDIVPAIVLAFLVVVGYKGMLQQPIYAHGPTAEPAKARASSQTRLDPERVQRYERILERGMEEERLYLDPELTLPSLAERLSIPRNDLSELINRSRGSNFYVFVNTYRVDEVKRLLANPDKAHWTLLAIAQEAGFHSKATFNAAFKAIATMTPTQYRKTLPAGTPG